MHADSINLSHGVQNPIYYQAEENPPQTDFSIALLAPPQDKPSKHPMTQEEASAILGKMDARLRAPGVDLRKQKFIWSILKSTLYTGIWATTVSLTAVAFTSPWSKLMQILISVCAGVNTLGLPVSAYITHNNYRAWQDEKTATERSQDSYRRV